MRLSSFVFLSDKCEETLKGLALFKSAVFSYAAMVD